MKATLTPEDRLKRKLTVAITVCAIVTAALLVFIALYVEERNEVQRQYMEVYSQCVDEAQDILKDYTAETFDGQRKYNRATAQLNTARSVLFLSNAEETKKTTMNELYTAFVKYPKQMTAQAQEVAKALQEIHEGDAEKGYQQADRILAGLDKLGD